MKQAEKWERLLAPATIDNALATWLHTAALIVYEYCATLDEEMKDPEDYIMQSQAETIRDIMKRTRARNQ